MAIFNLFLHMYYTTTKVRIKRNEYIKNKKPQKVALFIFT